MADTGWVSPGTVVNDSSVGDYAWINPSNAKSSDDNYADFDCPADGEDSQYLTATNFGFSVPTSSIIDGIEVSIERKLDTTNGAVTGNVRDDVVKLYNANGNLIGNNKADTVTNWPTSDTTVTYGGASDLWGATWSASDINDSDFGVALQAASFSFGYGDVDHIRIKVYYTVVASVERSLSIKGQDTDSAERAFSIKGQDSDSVTRSLSIQGGLSATLQRSFSIKGQDTDAATRNLSIKGQDTANTTANLSIQGSQIDDTIRAMSIKGQDTDSTESLLSIRGQDTANAERAFSIKGQDDGSFVRSFSIRGYSGTLPEQDPDDIKLEDGNV
jgi:hypothetical protein